MNNQLLINEMLKARDVLNSKIKIKDMFFEINRHEGIYLEGDLSVHLVLFRFDEDRQLTQEGVWEPIEDCVIRKIYNLKYLFKNLKINE